MLTRVAATSTVCALAVLLASCTHRLRLEMPRDMPMKLEISSTPQGEDLRRSKVLPPNSPEHHHLQEWLARNQRGWSRPMATDPSTGIYVTVGSLRLQFSG